MNAQNKLDKVLCEAMKRSQEEVSALVGCEFTLLPDKSRFVSKEEYFFAKQGKLVTALIDIKGDMEGQGGLVIGLRDAIRLGGTLIMLPESELQSLLQAEKYEGELADSYGEIANIIAGAYTKTFEDLYPKKCRLIRTDLSVVAPLKVAESADDPFPTQDYYWISGSIRIGDDQLDHLDLLLPVQAFDLQKDEKRKHSVAEPDCPAPLSKQESKAIPPGEKETSSLANSVFSEEETGKDVQNMMLASGGGVDGGKSSVGHSIAGKDGGKIHAFFQQFCTTSAQDLANLLSLGLDLRYRSLRLVDCPQEEEGRAQTKRVGCAIAIEAVQEKGFFVLDERDIIELASRLVEDGEIEGEDVVAQWNPDTEDACKEILRSCFTIMGKILPEQYGKNSRFYRADEKDVFVPVAGPLFEGWKEDGVRFCLAEIELLIDERTCGLLKIYFPASLFPGNEIAMLGQGPISIDAKSAVTTPSRERSRAPGSKENSIASDQGCDVLILENDRPQADALAAELARLGVAYHVVSFHDKIGRYVTRQPQLIFIVMKEVDEQGFGVIIKANTLGSAPIIAVAEQWTRTKVIKAVKYGIADILVAPALSGEIREKVQRRLMLRAA